MSRLPQPVAPLLLAAAALSAGCGMTPVEPAPATAQRPSFSTSSATTAAGTFEMEAGVQIDSGSAHEVPLLLKYGADSATRFTSASAPSVRPTGSAATPAAPATSASACATAWPATRTASRLRPWT
ncbi:MAG: hypothetical protein D6702_06295 [Planctomycetota bacterium]|nr:MAG: hypothetical protein D6702_06295 [Planctomycetota bacterium]